MTGDGKPGDRVWLPTGRHYPEAHSHSFRPSSVYVDSRRPQIVTQATVDYWEARWIHERNEKFRWAAMCFALGVLTGGLVAIVV